MQPTALGWAGLNGQLACVELLLQHGADARHPSTGLARSAECAKAISTAVSELVVGARAQARTRLGHPALVP